MDKKLNASMFCNYKKFLSLFLLSLSTITIIQEARAHEVEGGKVVEPEVLKIATESDDLNESDRSHSMFGLMHHSSRKRYIYSKHILSVYNLNYILPVSYMQETNDKIKTSLASRHKTQKIAPDGYIYDDNNDIEIKYKLSLMAFVDEYSWARLYAYYEQLSFWQAYSSENSRPFRSTVYNPGVIFHTNGFIIGKETSRNIVNFNFGIDHQSNGQGLLLSRSWNRVFSSAIFRLGSQHILDITTWYRFPESSKEDDNPDLSQYIGYSKVSYTYRGDKFFINMKTGGNYLKGHPFVEGNLSFPLLRTGASVNALIQVYSGYGESLVDYDFYMNRVSIGLVLK